jgi:hypothetical protein
MKIGKGEKIIRKRIPGKDNQEKEKKGEKRIAFKGEKC